MQVARSLSIWSSLVYGSILIAAIFVADQITKWWITETILRQALGAGEAASLVSWLVDAPARLSSVSIPVLPFFNLSMVWNEGISFGFLHQSGWLLLTIVSLVIASVFFVWMVRSDSRFERVALAMIVGGAIGNAFDRIRFGAVADFFHLHWGEWYFPAFNIADSAISVGVVLLLIQGLFFAKKSA